MGNPIHPILLNLREWDEGGGEGSGCYLTLVVHIISSWGNKVGCLANKFDRARMRNQLRNVHFLGANAK